MAHVLNSLRPYEMTNGEACKLAGIALNALSAFAGWPARRDDMLNDDGAEHIAALFFMSEAERAELAAGYVMYWANPEVFRMARQYGI